MKPPFLFLFLLLFCRLAAAASFRLEAVPSTREIYQGEQLTIQYNIVGDANQVEVEVSKFPEFRGFWSENLLLRQGPLPLVSPHLLNAPGINLFQELPLSELRNRFRTSAGPKRGTMGTYLLTPMVGKEELKIEPMKVVVKASLDGTEEQHLESADFPLTIKRLPALPANLKDFFSGAVGQFNIAWENTQIPYQPDEPVLIRLTLNGRGNFYEINSLPLHFPAYFETLSQKGTFSGSGQFATKTFDTLVTIHKKKEPLTFSPGKFLYFNPALKTFQTIELPPLFFVPAPPAPVLEKEEALEMQEREPERAALPWIFPLWGWGFQAALFLFLILDLLRSRKKERLSLPSLSTGRRLHSHYRRARTQWRKGQKEAAEESLYALANSLLKSSSGQPSPTRRRSEKLAEIERQAGKEVRAQVENFLHAFEMSRYHPSHHAMQPTEIYLKSLKICLKKIA